MLITILKNFGLNGVNLKQGETVEIDPSHFGDNIASFEQEGFFEPFQAPKVETSEAEVAIPADAKVTLPVGEPAKTIAPTEVTTTSNVSRFTGLNNPPAPESK